jgi:hypothetical protein
MGGVMVSLSVKDIPEQYAILKVLNFEMWIYLMCVVRKQ